MPTLPQSIDDLFRYQAEIARLFAAAEARGDTSEAAEWKELLQEVNSAIRRGVLADLAGQVAILNDLRAKIERLTLDTQSWPFGGREAPDDHERPFGEEVPENDFQDMGPASPPPEPSPVAPSTVPTVAPDWSSNYLDLWKTMTITPDRGREANAIASRIVSSQGRYAAAVQGTKVPWWFLAVVHAMECSLRFDQHPHNGDKLTARTTRVPKNRPAFGNPPYSWEDSAADALVYHRLDAVTDWSLASALYHWHRFNGINNEYKRRNIPTPYLWSGCGHYQKGKYVADHVFDAEAVSKQIGAAVLLRTLVDLGAVSLSRNDNIVANPVAAAESVRVLAIDNGTLPPAAKDELEFPGILKVGAGKTAKEKKKVRRLQEWLNLNNCVTPIDGDFGESTVEQLRVYQARTNRMPTGELDADSWAMLTASMRQALAPIDHGLVPTLEDSVLRVASQHIAQKPTEVGGDNRGPWVRLYMDGVEGKEQKWCAGFVCAIVAQAARDLGMAVPFRRQVGVDALVGNAKPGRYIPAADVPDAMSRRSKLKPGYLFVVRASAADWVHVGIVTNIKDATFDTSEGNTSGDGGTDGTLAGHGNRSYTSKDFLRLI